MARDLTDLQLAAIDEYFANGFKKRKALKDAGYSDRSARHSFEFFSNPKVQYEIQRRKQEIAERANISLELVLQELWRIASFNFGTIMDINEEDGSFTIDMRELDEDMKSVIAECTVETYTEGRGDAAEEVKRVRIKPCSKDAALDKLMRWLGAYNDKVTILDSDIAKELQAGRNRVAAAKRGEDDGELATPGA